MSRSSLCSWALSMAIAARRAKSSPNGMSPGPNRRPSLPLTQAMTPSVRSRVLSGTVSALLRSRERIIARCSSSMAASTSISSGISGISWLSPLRSTPYAPESDSGSVGYFSWNSSASAIFSGSRWATASWRRTPSCSSWIEHQSATPGTASHAMLRRVDS